MARYRTLLKYLPEQYLHIENWPVVNIDLIDQEKQADYLNRCRAIKMYMEGSTLKNIANECKIDSGNVIKLVKRCITPSRDGTSILGFEGIIPNRTIKEYSRNKDANYPLLTKKGYSGAFRKLLEKYPVLQELIEFYIFKKHKKKAIHYSKIPIEDLHNKFIQKCRELGLEKGLQYPFNTMSLAYSSLSRYVNDLLKSNPDISDKINGEQSRAKNSTSTGINRPDFGPFDRVECDAHKINAIFCVLVPSPYGEIIPMIVKRSWLLTIQDVCTRAVLGYQLVISEEPNRFDVLKCIKHALIPWSPRTEEFVSYKENSGFPSVLDIDIVGSKWKEFSVDNALANVSNTVTNKLIELMGIEPKVLKRTNKDDRPFVERLFKTLEEKGFHKLPNTTGSNITDQLRDQPELKACKYYIQIENLHALTDSIIANYNGSPHYSIGKRTPLEYLKYRCNLLEQLPEKVDELVVDKLHMETKKVRVKGDQKKGVRPYVNFMYSKYHSQLLRSSYSMCGEEITVEYDSEDIRFINAYLSDGSFIGSLQASPPWHLQPNSIRLRAAIHSLIKKKVLILEYDSNPIDEYLKYCESKSKKEKIVSNRYIEARSALVQHYDETKEEQIATVERKRKRNQTSTDEPYDLPARRRAKY